MDFKILTYEIENQYLSPYAKKSAETAGRARPLAPCQIRTAFQRDRDRIIHCKAFRRMKHKTQVFISPEGDHYRTRLTHTLEVAQIARTLARALRLNEDLTEAIALGHDLGHTPFGHAGEAALSELTRFEHNEQSLRVVDILEYDFKGMNLTAEVRDGILNHKMSTKATTLEGVAVSYADRIAYINHDIDDAERAGILSERDLPPEHARVLGDKHGVRINNMIMDIIENSMGKDGIFQSPPFERAMTGMRQFMFDRVYIKSEAKEEEGKAKDMIRFLYNYYIEDLNRLPAPYRSLLEKYPKEQVVCDYIAAMSDRYSVSVFESLIVPKGWAKPVKG
ncbi:MAG: deoxyguanosinetriphosphate triphosphohydrolase [Clostridiales bacterium]|jgi:dGTPase|nr:deoxyguanosinetriphosphate triphosphohydrolase [Clostridiales bacterium]